MFDRHLLSKTLSKVASASVDDILNDASEEIARHAHVVGITGAPGAGKSTLIGRLAAYRLRQAQTLAIIAIDPTSPHSGGSLLGDRIRMGKLSEDPRVFIRSLPSRTAEDGLTENVAEIIITLDRFGFDEVLIETVGVGQTAYGIRALADFEVLVLTPGSGDYIQAMKAGIMETADVFVVNKSDQPGADQVVVELLGMLGHRSSESQPPVIQIRPDNDAGVVELNSILDRYFIHTSDQDIKVAAERARRKYRIRNLIQRRLHETLNTLPDQIWDESLFESYRRVMLELRTGLDS